ncbi:MAG: serine hydrolase domain-containing protein, partial [Bacteroidota bacterium]
MKNNDFQSALSEHIRGDLYSIEKDAPSSAFQSLLDFLRNYDLVILSLHGTTMRVQSGYGITDKSRQFIESVLRSYKTVFVDFGNPYSLSRFRSLEKATAVILGYEDFKAPMVAAAQLISGATTTDARLPVAVPYRYMEGAGISSSEIIRLKRTFPEELGIPSESFSKMDSIVRYAIKSGVMPGCQVLVAKDGRIIYEKAFGYQTWDSLSPVRTDDIYDVASVTKVAATALAVMKGYDNGYFKLNEPLSKYYSVLSNTDKKDLSVLDVMTHQSGLEAWIPFWKKTVDNGSFIRGIYSERQTDDFPYRVSSGLYLRRDYNDSLKKWIFDSPLENSGKYVYSDLGPIMLRWACEE